MLLESSARFWLIVHAVLGGALVAVATHLVVWARGAGHGRPTRWRGVRIFATVGFVLYVGEFALGNLIYPAYKLRVRTEYLDDAAAIRADVQARRDARALAERRRARELGRPEPAQPPAPIDVPQLSAVSNIFDIKEHWVALGLALSAAACALTWAHDPRRARDDERARNATRMLGRLLLACALGAALVAWIGLLVGFYVTSFRSIGALG